MWAALMQLCDLTQSVACLDYQVVILGEYWFTCEISDAENFSGMCNMLRSDRLHLSSEKPSEVGVLFQPRNI